MNLGGIKNVREERTWRRKMGGGGSQKKAESSRWRHCEVALDHMDSSVGPCSRQMKARQQALAFVTLAVQQWKAGRG